MFLSYLSAKSVACRRLNVVGVRSAFFFPFDVISLTTSEEFDSVKNTFSPMLRCHLSRRWSWVDFPEPSIPSTMMSFPWYEAPFLVVPAHLHEPCVPLPLLRAHEDGDRLPDGGRHPESRLPGQLEREGPLAGHDADPQPP